MSTFPVDTCVVACSGPSLNKVDVFSLGIPVCAISTAIRSVPVPDYWFLADYLNEMHGQQGKDAWYNEHVVKVVPESVRSSNGKNVIVAEYMPSKDMNPFYKTVLFDSTKAILRGPHKSVTFALQWLHRNGVKNIIFAGNDLQANSFEEKYSYELEPQDKKKQKNFLKTIDQVKQAFIDWYPIAKEKGYNWYSWECGTAFEQIVPKFTPDIVSNLNINIPEENTSAEVISKEIPANDQKTYFSMLREARQSKHKFKDTNNMDLYFKLLHQKRNKNK
jgi:hypothetical protein